jgi:hypothetical protein
MGLTIDLPDSQLERLQELASELGVSAEDLARAVVADQLAHPREDFEAVASRVLDKNSELYRRLA